jgi:hypothetical protein
VAPEVEQNVVATVLWNHVHQRIALAILQANRNQPALKIMNTSVLALFSVKDILIEIPF